MNYKSNLFVNEEVKTYVNELQVIFVCGCRKEHDITAGPAFMWIQK